MMAARLARMVFGLLFALQSVLIGQKAVANGLDADVSERLIAITTAFVGGNVVVFGAIDEPEADVVITMEGPRQKQMVRRKSRIAGIWINRDRLSFEGVPSYYAIASTRPLEEIATDSVRQRFQLGVDDLALTVDSDSGYSAEEIDDFKSALIRNKQKIDLYTTSPINVTFPGSKLFRATFSFPANVPPGLYRIEVLKLQGGQVTGAQQSSLEISKVGMEADVFDFANQRSALYGMLAIVIAVAAGWTAGVVFRRA
jgi:uncharacterized protein (TIGR02186 family)